MDVRNGFIGTNRDGHLVTPGPEIWRQTDGRLAGELFDPAFLRSKKLPLPAWLDRPQ